MGNEAVAAGALAAGVGFVSGYPGTPSTEALETCAKRSPGSVHVEWSVNEKAALEAAAGAAYCGVRALVTMKQMGLNVASDPLMCLNYIGVKGGLVVYVADDPGPISSQTEQDTRRFGQYARIPVFDPSSPEEAFGMIRDAFDFSERHRTPVILRSTTRICHSCAAVETGGAPSVRSPGSFEKDSRWVIFPKLSYNSKKRLVAREPELSAELSAYPGNALLGSGPVGIACGGVSCAYVREAIRGHESQFTVFKVATPYPFPEELAGKFLDSTERVLVFEELDPVIEDALVYLCGKTGRKKEILGKRTGTVITAGELSSGEAARTLDAVLGTNLSVPRADLSDAPALPVRPPVLCAGCPHRASFYAVKKAMEGKRCVWCGDIGCYTLGNAAPLGMVDTCLCMGAGITLAQGIFHAGNGSVNFAFVGDSTFFASGMTGVANAVYNGADIVLIVLDNSTTAMTGHQPHPGTGRNAMGGPAQIISIPAVLRALGVKTVLEADPLDQKAALAAVREAAEGSGVRAVIFRSPCAAIVRSAQRCAVDPAKCIGCKKCIRELGCPALAFSGGKAAVDGALCTGCGLCAGVCPVGAIGKEAAE